jgi:hypothetical protein
MESNTDLLWGTHERVKKIRKPPAPTRLPTNNNRALERNSEGLLDTLGELENLAKKNWGATRPGFMDSNVESVLNNLGKDMKNVVSDARAVAAPVAAAVAL